MNIQDIYYHGVRDQIRRVLTAMSNDEIDRGLTAFETGSSNWSHCFFARALPGLGLDYGEPEQKLMLHLSIDTPIPIRMVYCTFDGLGKRTMTPTQLRTFVEDIRDERRPKEVLELIRTVDFTGAEDRPVAEVCN